MLHTNGIIFKSRLAHLELLNITSDVENNEKTNTCLFLKTSTILVSVFLKKYFK